MKHPLRAVPRVLWLAPPVLLGLLLARGFDFGAAATGEESRRSGAGARTANEDRFRPEADPPALKAELDDALVSDRWIYHDLDVVREQARESGKPILALFRCVPCGSAPGLDGAVCTAGGAEASEFEARIRAAGGKLDELLDRFVAVRVVKMNGVNRNVFQFDRDVPYVAVFLNADGVVYGRYETRISNERKNLPRHNLASFQRSLERALALHGDYPRNKADLDAKREPARTPAFAEAMTTFVPFPEKYNPVVKNCIHCHTVGEAELRERVAKGPLELRDVWPYPRPDNVGLRVDVEDGLLVESVAADSSAARAGIERGDVLLRLDDQPLVSEADVQWALHHAPDEGTIPVTVRRGTRTVETKVALEGDWRRNRVRWRATMNVLRPEVLFDSHPKGLRAYYPTGRAARAGIRGNDLVVAVDGQAMRSEAEFLKYLHIDKPKATSVELTILRNGEKSTVTLPVR